jgi:hypothetical protein
MALFDKDKKSKSPDAPDAPVLANDGTTVSTDGTVDRDLAPLTHPEGAQTVDKAEDKVLPDSSPDEIAPIPDGSPLRQPKSAPSTTGYRVAQGKSVAAGTGDHLLEGQEIGPGHVGGQERLDQLEKAGVVVKTDRKGGEEPASAKAPERETKPATPEFDAGKPSK